eukprot:Clim_evm3s7 gene=Clim_evmTU3s7
MKLNSHTVCVFLVSITVAESAPAAQPANFAECPHLISTANTTAWEGVLRTAVWGRGEWGFEYIMHGHADMTPLAKIVVQQGTDFEDYMEDKAGNFAILDYNGFVDPFYSLLWKLNALTAPILMAPYEIERTEKNAADWDAWWYALHDLTPSNEGMEARCFKDAQEKWFKPWAVTFPSFMNVTAPLNHQYQNQTSFDYATTRVWEVLTRSKQTSPNTGFYSNTLNQCVTTQYSYSETITESTGSSSSQTYSESTKKTKGLEIGAKASTKFLGVGLEISTKMSMGLERTAAKSTTEGTSQSVTESRTVSFDASPLMRRNSYLNVTVWTDQTEADIWFTGDIMYDPELTGIQAWIQGNGRPRLGNASQIPNLLYNNKLTTPAAIRNVAELAMKVIGAEWSDAFLNSLVSPSVAGFAESIAGNNIFMEMWECDRSKVPNLSCNEELAAKFPPPATCETQKSLSGMAFQAAANSVQTSDSHTAPQAVVDQLEAQNYKLEPVSGHKNRWRILAK